MNEHPDARGEPTREPDAESPSQPNLALFHLRIGWWSLLVFVTLGLILEGMHAFKVDWYLRVDHEIRRLMWTLSHAHGTLTSLVQVAFAATVSLTPDAASPSRRLASRCLLGAGVLLPAGFFLGGLGSQGGDPSLGILLVPVGGLLLLVGVLLTAVGLRHGRRV